MKVYEVVAVLLIAGVHAPVMPLVDVVGNAGMEAPLQNGPTAANVGVVFALILTVNVVTLAHCGFSAAPSDDESFADPGDGD